VTEQLPSTDPAGEALHAWSARRIAAAVRSRELSVLEVVEHHLERMTARSELNAFITIDADGARARARHLDRAGAGGKLAGVPLAPKDVFDTAGLRTTYGSRIFEDHVPARTAPAVQALVDAGAVVVGKANLDEFARGVMTRNPFFGACHNPRLPGRTPAGSSGGNAASLAAGLVALGLATDAGGSIRGPSAACGTAGFKPSFGLVSTELAFGLAAPFDHVGPMARSVDDCVLAMNVLVGLPEPRPQLDGVSVGLTAPIPRPERLEEAGADVEVAAIPAFAHLIPFHLAEFAYSHHELFAARSEDYSEPCARMIRRGLAVTAVEYKQLAKHLQEWRRSCEEALPYDVLVSPALGGEPPLLDEPETLDLLLEMSRLTRPFNMLGWPAAVARDGVMFAGRSDAVVLAAALAWEEALPPVATA
jgi:aspartyl-tRNA(Asn)/glutamyl-tRNA(Gln) amidotransferase subunit A